MSNTSLLGAFGGQGDSSLMFRNRIINGDMRIDQRATATGVQGAYTVDRWLIGRSDDATATWAQNVDAPSGFTHSLRQTITTADASIAATQYNGMQQCIEGFNIADFAWGTSAARPITISFWVRSSVIGQYTGNVRNKDDTRICPFSYSISAANTWEFKIVTIPGCPDGTWLTNNDIGLRLQLYAALGSTYLGGVDGAWNSTLKYGSGSPVNGLNANGNIFAITGVQVEAGPTATPFERRLYSVEELLCKRYCHVTTGGLQSAGVSTAAANWVITMMDIFPVQMRTTPVEAGSGSVTVDLANTTGNSVGSATIGISLWGPLSARLEVIPGVSAAYFRSPSRQRIYSAEL